MSGVENLGGISFEVLTDTKDSVERLNQLIDKFEKVETSSKKASSGISKIGSIARNTFIGLSAISGVGMYALDKFTSRSIETADKLSSISKATSLSTNKLQQFAKAGQAVNSGLNFNSVVSQVEGLHKRLSDVKMGRGDSLPFFRIGIDPFAAKDAFEVMEKIRGVVSKIHPSVRGNVIEKLGLSPEMLNVLTLSNKQLQSFSRFVLSSKEIAGINKMGVALRTLKGGFIDLKDKAVARLAPAMTSHLEKAFDWLLRNGDKITSAIEKFATGLAWVTQVVTNSLVLFGDFIGRITGMKNGLLVLAGVGVLVGASFAPLLATFTALLLLLDDIQVWREGGESLFGGFYDGIEAFSKKMKSLTSENWFSTIVDSLKELNKQLGTVPTLLLAVSGAFATYKVANTLGVGTALSAVAKSAKMLTSPLGLAVGAGGLAVDAIMRGKDSLAGQAFSKIKEVSSPYVEKISNWIFPKKKDEMAENSVLSPSPSIGDTTTNSAQTTINANINVASPKEGADALRQIHDNFNENSFTYAQFNPSF